MAADRLIRAAPEQHERPGSEGDRRRRIIGSDDREAKPKQAGHDRLHHPLRQTAADQPRRQAEQIRLLIDRLSEGPPQGIPLQPHIGIDEQHPAAAHLLHGTGAGPVLADPALPLRTRSGLNQLDIGCALAMLGNRAHRQVCGGIAGVVIHHQHLPAAAGDLTVQHSRQAVGDVGGFVVGRNHHTEGGGRQRSIRGRLQFRRHGEDPLQTQLQDQQADAGRAGHHKQNHTADENRGQGACTGTVSRQPRRTSRSDRVRERMQHR